MYTVFPFYSFLLSIQFIHLASLTGRPRFNRDTRCRPNIFLWTVAYPAPQGSVTHSEKSAIWHLQHTWPHDWIFTLWSTGSQLSHPANSAAMASNAGWGFVGIQTQIFPKWMNITPLHHCPVSFWLIASWEDYKGRDACCALSVENRIWL